MSDPRRPELSEYPEYYRRYTDLVPEGPILESLEASLDTTLGLLGSVSPGLEEHRYAPGKWSVRQVVGHVLDVERNFGYRALFVARGEGADLPSFDQDAWAATSGHATRPLVELAAELELVRRSHLLMLRSLPGEAWLRRGTAAGSEFTVRAFPWILLGHEIHHRKILEERYLSGLEPVE